MDNKAFEEDVNSNTKQAEAEGGVVVAAGPPLTEKEIKKEKFRIMKNVIVIAFAFMLLFTAFQTMASLQSSINKVDGLGVWSLSMIYASLLTSCMFLPTIIIKKLTVKWTMVFSMFCYSTYIAAQFYPEFYTLIPGAIILGLGAAPMWSAKCTYLTQIGSRYAELDGTQVEPVIVRFFGIFFLFFQFASVWGNLISSSVLSQVPKEVDRAELYKCGTNYCPASPAPKNETAAPSIDELISSLVNTTEAALDEAEEGEVSKGSIYTLAGIFLVCSLLSAVIVAFLVDPLSRYGENERDAGKEKLTGVQLLKATFNHLKKPYQLLIVPLTFWSGVEQGFFSADFTAGFVTCAYGVHNVGFVLIAYGACDAICSFSFGFVIKKIGRIPIFVMGCIVNFIVIGVLFNWSPNPDEYYVYYFMAALWGISDAVWQTQINALYGVLFESESEAAFSNYRLWESLGFLIAYILQVNVCIYTKLWCCVAVLITGMAGYLTIEFMEWRKEPEEKPNGTADI